MNNVPAKLQELQLWFGSVIASKISKENRLLPEAEARNFREEAARYILPTKQLEPFERIGIYHQQYWWRLITVLQENFPSLTRFLGHEKFNDLIAIPYLLHAAPQTFALCRFGDTLLSFLKKNLKDPERQLLLSLAQVDWAMNKALWIKNAPPIALPIEKISLQPHVFLLKSSYDIFSFREQLLKNSAPAVVRGKFYFLFFRERNNCFCWKYLSCEAYSALKCIEKTTTLKKLCRKYGDLLPVWLFEWTTLSILR